MTRGLGEKAYINNLKTHLLIKVTLHYNLILSHQNIDKRNLKKKIEFNMISLTELCPQHLQVYIVVTVHLQ